MGIAIAEGEKIPLVLLTETRNTSLFVKATIRNASGNEISGSPTNVPHKADGFYFGDSIVMPNSKFISVEYDVFDDALFLEPNSDNLLPTAVLFDLDDFATTLEALKILTRGVDLQAIINDSNNLIAILNANDSLSAIIKETPLQAILVEDNEIVAVIDSDDTLEGEIK